MLFLGPLIGGAHVFDSLARHFTDRFHVLGLTRRGTEPSATPPSGYETGTLAEDIRAFLDALNIRRATLVGYSIAGDEMTRFAGVHPQRTARLLLLVGERPGGDAASARSLSCYFVYQLLGKDEQSAAAAFSGNPGIRFEYTVLSNIYSGVDCRRSRLAASSSKRRRRFCPTVPRAID